MSFVPTRISQLPELTSSPLGEESLPVTDSTTTSKIKIKNLFLSNPLSANAVDINGGTIDGTVIGGASAAAGTFTTLSATGAVSASATTPIYRLTETDQGVDGKVWDVIAGTGQFKIRAVSDDLASATDVVTVSRSGISPTTLQVNCALSTAGNTTLGDASTDTVTVNGYMGIGVAPSAWVAGNFHALQIGAAASLVGRNTSQGSPYDEMYLSANAYNDGSWKYIGTAAATQYYQDAGTHVWRYAASGTAGNAITFSEAMRIDSSGQVGIGLTPTARNNTTFQIVDGIGFPATQVASSDANTLDDYEEGTFTPTIVGTSTAGTGTYTVQSGEYTKVGRKVTISLQVGWSAHTGTGNMIIGALPFASAIGANKIHSHTIGYITNVALTANNYALAFQDPNTSTIVLRQVPTGGGAIAAVPIDTAGTIGITGTYFV